MTSGDSSHRFFAYARKSSVRNDTINKKGRPEVALNLRILLRLFTRLRNIHFHSAVKHSAFGQFIDEFRIAFTVTIDI